MTAVSKVVDEIIRVTDTEVDSNSYENPKIVVYMDPRYFHECTRHQLCRFAWEITREETLMGYKVYRVPPMLGNAHPDFSVVILPTK